MLCPKFIAAIPWDKILWHSVCVWFCSGFEMKQLSECENCDNSHVTLTTGPLGVTQTRTLSGFRSRWVIPRLCRKATALQSCFTTVWLRCVSGGLESRYWFKSPPSQYSITSHKARQRWGPGWSSCLWAGLFLPLFWGLCGVVVLDILHPLLLSWGLTLAWMVLVLSWSLQTELLLLWVFSSELLPSWICCTPTTLPFRTLSTSRRGSFPALRGFRLLGPVCRRQSWSAITLTWFLAVDLMAHSSCR